MKLSASGRIIFWRGGSLWIGRAGEPAEMHAHHALQISLPFASATVKLQIPGGDWTRYEAAIVVPEQPHAFDARGHLMAQIFIEPESREGQQLQRLYGARGVCGLDAELLRREVTALAAAYERRGTDAQLVTLSRDVISKLTESSLPTTTSDKRIVAAIEQIRAGLTGTISLNAVAASVHLSPDRFRHLFLEETGVRLRPYVLWLRLERALEMYVSGSSLTDAAYAGGFADSAHFSRTFKKMFGISPASVRPEQADIR